MKLGTQDYLINKILDDTFVIPQNLYLGLALTQDSAAAETDDLKEVSGGGYSKQPIKFANDGTGFVYNVDTITFDPATSDWTTGGDQIEAVGIFEEITPATDESPAEYNLLVVQPLFPAETILSGEVASFNANSIRYQLTNK